MNESAAENLGASLSDLDRITRAIADTTSDSIITIDEAGRMLFVNRAAEKMFGHAREKLLGQALTMLLPDYPPATPGKEIVSSEPVELLGVHQSGREIPLELSFAEFNENGRRLFTGVARDITERHNLERRLDAQFQVAHILASADSVAASASELLQAIGESVGWEVGQLWRVDRESDVLRWAGVWRKASVSAGNFEEESRKCTFARGVGLPGRIWAAATSEWISDIATDPNFTRGPAAAKAGLRSAFGLPIRADHRVSGVMEFFCRTTQVPDQSLLGIMNIIGQQIGHFVERKRAEEERVLMYDREQRARRELEIAIDRMKQVQTVTDVALSHLAMDELLAELLTRVREAMKVDTVAILLLESDGDQLVAWAARGLEEEVDLGVRIPVGSGFAGKVAATKTPVRIDDVETADILNPLLREKGIQALLGVPLLVEGRVIGVIHIGRFTHEVFTDGDTRLLQLVADRIALAIENARLFDEERTARHEAEAASRAKDQFLTTISHELRTPLTPIIGWIHMIRNGILPEEETGHGLSVIERNSHSLKRLINDLLDMSAILSGKMRMEELPVSLEDVVREAVETVRPAAAERNIEIVVNFRNWHHELVTGDRARLLQVFWNLLHNAVKFSFPGGRVEVDAETGASEVTVRIQDAGQGIAPEFLPFVFERFRQADGSRTRLHGGLGLGLALAKSFVDAHNGTVEAESVGTGQGSRFTVRLPLRENKIESLEPKPAHLMIVEDDLDTLEMLRANLEARGFRVTACQSATETLAVAPGTPVDLIISDLGMPEMDGLHLITRLRETPAYQNVPAIALSGYASRKDANAAIAAGFDAHVSKPVDPAELVIMVNGLLERTSSAKK